MLKVFIPENIPSLNKGEEAILRGIKKSLDPLGNFLLMVFSSHPDDDKPRFEPDVKVIEGLDFFSYYFAPINKGKKQLITNLIRLLGFAFLMRITCGFSIWFFQDPMLRAFGEADLILAGHDGLLGVDHYWLYLASKIMKKPIIFFGSGGSTKEIAKRSRRQRLKNAVEGSLLITVRDQMMKDFLINLGVTPSKINLYPDPAFLLPAANDSRVQEIFNIEKIGVKKTPLICIIAVQGGIVAQNSFVNLKTIHEKRSARIEFWATFINFIIEQTDAEILFLPHCIGPSEDKDDRKITADIIGRLTHSIDRVKLFKYEYNASELKGVIKHSDYIIGERAHAMIGAVSVGTPCLALTVEEDNRINDIIGRLAERPVFHMNNPNIEELKKMFIQEWDNRSKTKEVMKNISDNINRKANEAAELLRDKINENIKWH